MARIKKAQVGKKLTVKRTREVADSLESAGYKKIASSALSKIASKDTRDSLSKSGWKDVDNAYRYKKLASKAEAKSMKSGGKSPAWQRKEGQSPTGGLNAKGRASLKAQGQNIKPPQPGGGPRKKSYCARSAGQMKMFPKAAKDPNSRLRLARKKWKC